MITTKYNQFILEYYSDPKLSVEELKLKLDKIITLQGYIATKKALSELSEQYPFIRSVPPYMTIWNTTLNKFFDKYLEEIEMQGK